MSLDPRFDTPSVKPVEKNTTALCYWERKTTVPFGKPALEGDAPVDVTYLVYEHNGRKKVEVIKLVKLDYPYSDLDYDVKQAIFAIEGRIEEYESI
jgi:hypothetical protein